MRGTHVCSPDFVRIHTHEEYYRRYINYFKGKKLPKDLDGFTLEVLLQEAYHDIYEITDLDNNNIPMPLIAYTNADTLGDFGPIGELLGEYRNNDINGLFGLSFTEFCDLPYHISRIMLNRAKAEQELEKEVKESVEREVEQKSKRNGYYDFK